MYIVVLSLVPSSVASNLLPWMGPGPGLLLEMPGAHEGPCYQCWLCTPCLDASGLCLA